MGNPKAKGRRGVQVDDGEETTLHELGKQLLKLQKYNKEAALKLLKVRFVSRLVLPFKRTTEAPCLRSS